MTSKVVLLLAQVSFRELVASILFLVGSNLLFLDFEKIKFPTRSLSTPPEVTPPFSPRRSQPHPPEDLEPMPFEPASKYCLVLLLDY